MKNNSSTAVRSITAIWALTDSNGHVISTVTGTHEARPGVLPGEMVMMAPISGLSVLMSTKQRDENAGSTRPTLQDPAQLNSAMANFIRNRTASEVSISLDSIIFQDHSFIGPDHAGKFKEENSERRIERELAIQLLNRTPSQRLGYLRAIVDDPAAQQSLATSELGQRHRMADSLLHQVAIAKDDEDLFRRSMENVVNNVAHELHRRRP